MQLTHISLSPLSSHSRAGACPKQNCTDHSVMLFMHPERKHKPLRPRGAGQPHRQNPITGVNSVDGGMGGSSGAGGNRHGGASSALHGFRAGGNSFFPGTSSSQHSSVGGREGDTGRSPGGSGNAGGVGGAGAGEEEDVTLVEPGKVWAERGC